MVKATFPATSHEKKEFRSALVTLLDRAENEEDAQTLIEEIESLDAQRCPWCQRFADEPRFHARNCPTLNPSRAMRHALELVGGRS